jgi:hypothetical protein
MSIKTLKLKPSTGVGMDLFKNKNKGSIRMLAFFLTASSFLSNVDIHQRTCYFFLHPLIFLVNGL